MCDTQWMLDHVSWAPAAELTRRYRVGEKRLLEHARRGHLACRRDARGQLCFDAATAATLFSPREQAERATAKARPQRSGFGVLGQLRLGETAAPARRRRPNRASAITTSVAARTSATETSAPAAHVFADSSAA